MEAAGSPIGRGGIPSEGSKGRREDELSGFLALFLFLLLAISFSPSSLSLQIFSSPRFLAPHAFGVSIVSPCLAETQREARFGLESIDYPKKLLRLRVLSVLYLFSYISVPLLPSWHARFRSQVSTR